MKSNVGKTDRLLRGILGLLIIGLGIVFKSWWGVIGIVLLLTSIISFCPMYIKMKWNHKNNGDSSNKINRINPIFHIINFLT